VWDKGEFETGGNAEEQLKKGKLVFTFYGRKLKGEFHLVKMWNQEKNWLITKSKDEFTDKDWKLETILKPKK
jgi:bifunctional non-homologous end joining protein LigD